MRLAVGCVLLFAACDRAGRAAPDAGEDGGAVVVVPGWRLGAMQVGMDRRALSRQGVRVTMYDGSAARVRAGPFDLRFNPAGRVERVSLPLDRAPQGVRLSGVTLPPDVDVDRVISVAPGCTPAVSVDGVPTWRCAGGGLLVQRQRGALVISVAQPLDAGQ